MSNPFPFPDDFPPEATEYLSDNEQSLVDEEEPHATFPETVLVFGLPKVTEGEKHAKLSKLMKTKWSKSPEDSSKDCGFTIDMPINAETGKSDGAAWLKFQSRKEALKARDKINGQSLSAGKLIHAILFDDYDGIMETEDNFNPAIVNNSINANANVPPLDDTRNWLLDAKHREQLLLRFQQETQIFHIDPLKTLDPYYCGEREKSKNKVWCDWKVDWSPYGSFLITCHRPGVCLWGGPEMEQKRKFAHAEVMEFYFSPNEDYFVTWNGNDRASGDTKAYKLWDVLSGKCLKELACPAMAPGEDKSAFPHFLFSPDSQYLALMIEKEILFRTLPHCASYVPASGQLRFENGISHFSFSPKQNVIAVWSLQSGESPSCLHIINIETGERLQTRSRPQFNAQLSWQSEGDYLCVQLSRKGKINKDGVQLPAGKCRTLEILRMCERGIPVETIDVDCEGIKTIAWEPGYNSTRFALLTEHKDSAAKTVLLFYSLANSKCEQVASFELQTNTYNRVFWSPDGQYLVIAGIGSGELLWARLTPENHTLELLNKDDQVSLTDVQWDSSGRYLLTSVFQPICGDQGRGGISSGQDAGFRLWTFQGRPLHMEAKEKLYHAAFRPTPVSLLSQSEQIDLKRNLKQHARRFEQIDDEARSRSRREDREQREIIISQFRNVCNALNVNYGVYAKQIGWAVSEYKFQEDHQFREITDTVEEFVESLEEVIGSD